MANEKCSIEGLGTFVLNKKPSELRNNILVAPKKTINFVEEVHSDHLLSDELLKVYPFSENKANKVVSTFSTKVLNGLINFDHIVLKNLGKLKKKKKGIQFTVSRPLQTILDESMSDVDLQPFKDAVAQKEADDLAEKERVAAAQITAEEEARAKAAIAAAAIPVVAPEIVIDDEIEELVNEIEETPSSEEIGTTEVSEVATKDITEEIVADTPEEIEDILEETTDVSEDIIEEVSEEVEKVIEEAPTDEELEQAIKEQEAKLEEARMYSEQLNTKADFVPTITPLSETVVPELSTPIPDIDEPKPRSEFKPIETLQPSQEPIQSFEHPDDEGFMSRFLPWILLGLLLISLTWGVKKIMSIAGKEQIAVVTDDNSTHPEEASEDATIEGDQTESKSNNDIGETSNSETSDQGNAASMIKECIIITGSFHHQDGIDAEVHKLKRAGHQVYTEPSGHYTRVGFTFPCDGVNLKVYIDEIREQINQEAWYLVPDLEI